RISRCALPTSAMSSSLACCCRSASTPDRPHGSRPEAPPVPERPAAGHRVPVCQCANKAGGRPAIAGPLPFATGRECGTGLRRSAAATAIQRKGKCMAERLTKAGARNVFYGGSIFFFAIFVGLTAHSHWFIRTQSTDEATLTPAVARGKHVWE